MTRCAACGASTLVPHLKVAGDAGPDGLIPTTDKFGTTLADIVRCTACGHRQTDPMPADAVLESAYADAASEDYVAEESGQRETARRALERIEALLTPVPIPPHNGGPRRRTLLDLGCWVGFLLSVAEGRGWDATGVEPSEFASSFARDRLGLDVRTGDLFTTELPRNHYDAIVMGDVIEHLPRPGEALDRMAELLRPGGIAWLALPDAGSAVARGMRSRWWSVIPTHVQFFTRGSLRALLERHGWTVLDIASAPKAFSVRYYLERVGGYSPGLAQLLVRGARAARLADRMWAPDFHDRMAVIARPPERDDDDDEDG
ncbi:MAG TPA: class I SAM-dependent methyltransferase [Solirubrobacteraceae bacterium]|nr:class I SAM-dependent methyltransferase [Solirubrobacteraceae bacterium]